MNLQSANALLKTLEEPPAGTRLVLSCADPALLLPTVRSRCQIVRLGEPPADESGRWLIEHGVGQPEVLLAACGGRPLDALLLSQAGISVDHWLALPGQIRRGQAGGLSGWPLRLALDALQKLCHDAMSLACGGVPRYFPVTSLPFGGERQALMAWWGSLARVARHSGHAWHEPLLLDALVSQGSVALSTPASQAAPFDTLPE
jgi:DNA polymerase-3 subunit delta'